MPAHTNFQKMAGTKRKATKAPQEEPQPKFKCNNYLSRSTALGLKWFFNQQAAWDNAGDHTFRIKLGMKEFGVYSCRGDFVQVWCANQGPSLRIYEVIVVGGACRLYFDVEMIDYERTPGADEIKAWLLQILAVIAKALQAEDVDQKYINDVLVGYDCRPKGDNDFKRSFHLIYPEIVFANNHTSMKDFVHNKVLPLAKKESTLSWHKHNKNGPVGDCALDKAVYTKNRAWRLFYSHKEGKTAITPWDVDNWTAIEFDKPEDREDYFERTLCGDADSHDCGQFFSSQQPTLEFQPAKSQAVDKTTDRPDLLPSNFLGMAGGEPSRKEPANKAERMFATKAIEFMKSERKINYQPWRDMGFALSTVFGKDKEGLQLFDSFSQEASNYDGAAVVKVYNTASGSIGLGSIFLWLREDAPEIAKFLEGKLKTACDAVIAQEQRAIANAELEQQDTIPVSLDGHHAVQLLEEFNAAIKINKEAGRAVMCKFMAYMNQFLCFISGSSGKPVVLQEYHEPKAHRVVTRSCKDAKEAFCMFGHEMKNGDKNEMINPMQLWLRRSDARKYEQIVFDPSDNKSEKNYNLFRGLAILLETSLDASSPLGDCILEYFPVEDGVMRDLLSQQFAAREAEMQANIVVDHIRKIWCRGQEEVAEYILNWMAHLVQHPGVKMGTVPVLQGRQGSGKGIVIQKLAEILGKAHYMQVTDMDKVTGRFQSEDTKTNLLTFLDEALFSGNKKQSSALKGLITETSRLLEVKFVNPITIKNCSNYVIASNHDNMVDVETHDRRFLCLELDSKLAGVQTPEKARYFDRLLAVKPPHFAYFLYQRDISKFNPRDVPATSYKRNLKALNMDLTTTFLETFLREGQLDSDGFDSIVSLSSTHSTEIPKKVLFDDAYGSFASHPGNKYKHSDGKRAFFKKLHQILKTQKCKIGEKGAQVPSVRFPPLAQCRDEFTQAMQEKTWEWEQ
jgi:hypothetical protein